MLKSSLNELFRSDAGGIAGFIWWRNVSFLAVLALALDSIPRWQSLVVIAGLVIFFVFFAAM